MSKSANIFKQPCNGCGAELQLHWLRDGKCNACINPSSVVRSEPPETMEEPKRCYHCSKWFDVDKAIDKESMQVCEDCCVG